MQTQRQRFEQYFSLPGAKDLARERIILTAADAFDAATANGHITSDQLQVIVQAVSHRSTRIWESCCGLLAAASELWPLAAAAILQMSRESHAHVRFNAICSLSTKTPINVVNEVLKCGLADRSARVRWKAADKASSLNQRQLIPEIAIAVEREVNVRVKASMIFSLHFLKDGFLVERKEDGSYSVSVRLYDPPGGTVELVSENEFRTRGIESIVAEVRKKCSRVV